MNIRNGIFCISLDFELHWGVSESRTIESYYENLHNVPQAIDKMLYLFDKYQIHVTWATVGMLFCEDKTQLFELVKPADRPLYSRDRLSNYIHAEAAGANMESDPFHYALPIIQKIASFKNQEIATHTFSHYYCLEDGQHKAHFGADIKAATFIAQKYGFQLKSIVFPRNQHNPEYLDVLAEAGIRYYRNTQPLWFYQPKKQTKYNVLPKLFRFLDAYINISTKNLYKVESLQPSMNGMINIPQSRFLRPVEHGLLSRFENIRLNKIKDEMTLAAKQNKLYHLWWHPHNFGKNLELNLRMLEAILCHFEKLNQALGMKSLNMLEIGNYIDNNEER